MNSDAELPPIRAYEVQARYAPGEAWITLDVCLNRLRAVREAYLRHDPWGRAPIQVRIVGPQPQAGAS
jgi:hypothetical protein